LPDPSLSVVSAESVFAVDLIESRLKQDSRIVFSTIRLFR